MLLCYLNLLDYSLYYLVLNVIRKHLKKVGVDLSSLLGSSIVNFTKVFPDEFPTIYIYGSSNSDNNTNHVIKNMNNFYLDLGLNNEFITNWKECKLVPTKISESTVLAERMSTLNVKYIIGSGLENLIEYTNKYLLIVYFRDNDKYFDAMVAVIEKVAENYASSSSNNSSKNNSIDKIVFSRFKDNKNEIEKLYFTCLLQC